MSHEAHTWLQKMDKNIVVLAEKGCFRPKIAVTAENNSYRRKFCYGRNFGYGRISYRYGVSAKILFRSHTSQKINIQGDPSGRRLHRCVKIIQLSWSFFGQSLRIWQVVADNSSWQEPNLENLNRQDYFYTTVYILLTLIWKFWCLPYSSWAAANLERIVMPYRKHCRTNQSQQTIVADLMSHPVPSILWSSSSGKLHWIDPN